MGAPQEIYGDVLTQAKKAFDESPEGQHIAWQASAASLRKAESDRQASEFPIVHGPRASRPVALPSQEIEE